MRQIRAFLTEGSCWCRLCPHQVPVSALLFSAVETGARLLTSLGLNSYSLGTRNGCCCYAMFMDSFLKTPEDTEIIKFYTHVRGPWKLDVFPPGREVGFLSPLQKPFCQTQATLLATVLGGDPESHNARLHLPSYSVGSPFSPAPQPLAFLHFPWNLA